MLTFAFFIGTVVAMHWDSGGHTKLGYLRFPLGQWWPCWGSMLTWPNGQHTEMEYFVQVHLIYLVHALFVSSLTRAGVEK